MDEDEASLLAELRLVSKNSKGSSRFNENDFSKAKEDRNKENMLNDSTSQNERPTYSPSGNNKSSKISPDIEQPWKKAKPRKFINNGEKKPLTGYQDNPIKKLLEIQGEEYASLILNITNKIDHSNNYCIPGLG